MPSIKLWTLYGSAGLIMPPPTTKTIENKTLIHSWFLQYTIRELHNQNLSMRKIKSFSCKTWLKHKDKA